MLKEAVHQSYGALMSKAGWMGVEEFFYRAMLDGWIAGKWPEPDETGHQTIESAIDTDLGLKLVDRWTDTPTSDWSAGSTTIYLRVVWVTGSCQHLTWVPLWAMHYGGQYPKAAAKVVMRALADAYGKGRPLPFQGCRGGKQCTWNGCDMIYRNALHRGGGFKDFAGTETVWNGQGQMLGYHEYFGLSLL